MKTLPERQEPFRKAGGKPREAILITRQVTPPESLGQFGGLPDEAGRRTESNP
jgi:hypothetical protein